MTAYKKGDVVEFKRRGKTLTGMIFGPWAPGEGDGYNIELADEYLDVPTKNIIRKIPKPEKRRKIGLKNLVVNALGEVINVTGPGPMDDEYICGTVNLSELATRLGHSPSNKEVRADFYSQLTSQLTAPAARRVSTVWNLQKFNDGRFRVWMRKGGEVVLSTEFNALVEQDDVWRKIDAAAKALHVKPDVMHEDKHVDSKSLDNGKTWIHGPKHGKMERQVSLDVRLTALTIDELRRTRKHLERVTEDAWNASGVNVI
jgi:hypothetical protein